MNMLNKAATPEPQGHYAPATRWKDLIFTAGMTPRLNGTLIAMGPVNDETPMAELKKAAQTATRNALAAANSLLDQDEEIASVLKATVFVAASSGFQGHSKVADLATEEVQRQLPNIDQWARSAVGVANLPGGALLEIELIASAKKILRADNVG